MKHLKNVLDCCKTIRKKAKQYEGKVIDLEKAIEEAENDCNENDQIAPATQQVEMEDAEIGPTESEQYVHFNPDRPTEHRLYDMSREVGIEARTVELTNHAKQNKLRQNQLTENDFAVLSTRTVSISDPTYRTNATHLFVENALVDNFNLQYISKLGSQKVKVKAVDTVCGDLPASVKTKLLSSLPEKTV
ncbi:Hypothetical predicted protein [Mytilus galloprovincialis]|uniref:Uncharacterized protein n=1 Tax=Mytilus galloprovincialis TaxID=29158 RepID=A0A8B6E5C9_MYTGA|nr:Hypothetical predicted protein [Mytilus galloprovincialis]